MILLFLRKNYLLRPFVLSMTHILPRDPTLKSRPSPSFLGLGFRLRSRCYSLNNIIIKINNNRQKTLFTAYALSAQDDSAGKYAPRKSFALQRGEWRASVPFNCRGRRHDVP